MDVVALAQPGFENAVATLGTACTAEHVQKLVRFTDSVVFSFDGDAAGRRAAGRALEASLPHATDTRSFRFLFLPPEHDPDSFVRELGAEAFEQRVDGGRAAVAQIVAQRRRRLRPRHRRRPGAVPGQRPAALDGAARRHAEAPAARRDRLARRRSPADELAAALARRRRAVARPSSRRRRPAPGRRRYAPRRAGRRRCASRRPGRLDAAARKRLVGDARAPPTTPLLCALPGWHGELFRFLDRADWPSTAPAAVGGAARADRRASPGRRRRSALVDGRGSGDRAAARGPAAARCAQLRDGATRSERRHGSRAAPAERNSTRA